MKPYDDPKLKEKEKWKEKADPKDYGKQGDQQNQKPKTPQGKTDTAKQPFKPGQMK